MKDQTAKPLTHSQSERNHMTLDEAKTIINLLRDTLAIQAELLKRSEYQVTQLKAEINLIDPNGELRLEHI